MRKNKIYNICNACGTRFDTFKNECPTCGLKIEKTEKKYYCSKCGKVLLNNNRLCDACLSKENKKTIKKRVLGSLKYSSNTGLDKVLYVIGGLLIISSASDEYIYNDKILIVLLGLSLFKIIYVLFSEYVYQLNEDVMKFFRIAIPIIIFFIFSFTSSSIYDDKQDVYKNKNNNEEIKENISESTTSLIIPDNNFETTTRTNDSSNSIKNNDSVNKQKDNNNSYVDDRKEITITLNYQNKTKKEIKIKEGDSFVIPFNDDTKTIGAGTVYFHPCIQACGPGDGFESIHSGAKYEVVQDGWEDILNKNIKYIGGEKIYPTENIYLRTVFKKTGNMISAVFPKISKDGYTFGGWWTGPYCSGYQNKDEYFIGTDTVNYYACWKNDN